MKERNKLIWKCILTGVIYSLVTCIIQVPVANYLFTVFNVQSDTSISGEQIPFLLLSIFIVGNLLALFYYRNGYLFSADHKWKQGFKFVMFIYLSNYIPQVFFLDANQGFSALINGGFLVIQVELFDFLILIITVLLMITYIPLPYYNEKKIKKSKTSLLVCVLCGILFSTTIIVLQEFLLPIFKIQSIASSLHVLDINIPFFYGCMTIGFILAGYLVLYYTLIAKYTNKNFCLEYGILIWCAFDLTMIPLGFSVLSTVTFIIVSMIAFAIVGGLCRYFIRLDL